MSGMLTLQPEGLGLDCAGNPDAQLADTSGLRWTIKCDRDTMLTAARVPAEIPSWAFVCQEADRLFFFRMQI